MTDRLDDHEGRDPGTLHAELGAQLDQAAKEVVRRMADGVSYEVAHQAVAAAYQRLAGHAQVHNFLPILAARSAQNALERGDLHRASGHGLPDQKS
ncbi:three-helix bundle dimerization domain-containing protein [Kutzneria sp. CA-103260]|uniref:three-helix bundle dimerization domain-containing protein n=1 Tax=Kutzneria sp. CA-103260 TaxID=2802641 RepID=UPI001BAA9E0D|nr:hypothetical protein [Kutzneria sp. CA-103260]